MQGFKHDGTARTPATTWIYSIMEYSSWTCENDPCALELEEGWRIPTKLEWEHVSVIPSAASKTDVSYQHEASKGFT